MMRRVKNKKKTTSRRRPRVLSTVYHPIVEMQSEKILGYEALTRGRGKWRMPEDLFRYSYEQGKTIALDFSCLRTAIKILPKLLKGDMLFLNVEPTTLTHTFMKGEMGDEFLKQISDYAHQIVIELTEGMKARDFELIKRGLFFIRKSGCQFAIDDVAGIDSKLIKLMGLNPDFMKIDMGLIKGLADNRLNQGIVKEIVDLAKEHKCWMIAEGVERKKDLELVRKIGIHYAQGFYYARPHKNLQRTLHPKDVDA